MNDLPQSNPKWRLTVLSVALLCLGCRVENPAFEAGDVTESETGTSDDLGDFGDSDGPTNTTQGNTTLNNDDTSTNSTSDAQGFCSAFEENLIACYEFEEVIGNLVPDGSRYNNHIHVSSTDLSSSGYWGNALESTANLEAYTLDNEVFDVEGFTIAVALYPHTIEENRFNGIVDNDLQYALFINDNYILCNDGNRWVMAPIPAINQWTRVMCTSDQERLRIYIEGSLVDELSPLDADRDENNTRISIGNMSPEFDQPFIGLIDNMRFWNRALSAEEIASLEG